HHKTSKYSFQTPLSSSLLHPILCSSNPVASPLADELVLLDFWLSPFAMRVRIALADGTRVQRRERHELQRYSVGDEPCSKADTSSDSQKQAHMRVPDNCRHKSPFLPCGPYKRAEAGFWADFVEKKVSFHLHVWK
ncbi:unnamed protein product, partial [Thlaspi arvense]